MGVLFKPPALSAALGEKTGGAFGLLPDRLTKKKKPVSPPGAQPARRSMAVGYKSQAVGALMGGAQNVR